MFPSNIEAVLAILLSIVPGFVMTTVWARARTWKGPSSDIRTILQSLALSGLVQTLLLPLTYGWIYPVRKQLEQYPERLAVWILLAVLVVPFMLGWGGGRLTDFLTDPAHSRVEGKLKRAAARIWSASAAPSVWDWLFTVRPPNERFLVVTFEDGAQLAGTFEEGSLALT